MRAYGLGQPYAGDVADADCWGSRGTGSGLFFVGPEAPASGFPALVQDPP